MPGRAHGDGRTERTHLSARGSVVFALRTKSRGGAYCCMDAGQANATSVDQSPVVRIAKPERKRVD